MEPLKEMFNQSYYEQLSKVCEQVIPDFDRKHFLKKCIHQIDTRALNERLRHTSQVLFEHLSGKPKKDFPLIKKIAFQMPTGYTSLVYPDFVSQYGMNEFDLSMQYLAELTSLGSSEFAVRHFLKADFERAFFHLKQWSLHDNHHVRRLSSESCRPRLPWSFKLDAVVHSPQLTRPVLDRLKEDESLYVRKSVANHINDFSKDHPKYVIDLVKEWKGQHTHTEWIIQHACRTLIKKGDPDLLKVMGVKTGVEVKLSKFKILKTPIHLGEDLIFSFEIVSASKTKERIIIDYIIDYCRPENRPSSKVFKLKSFEIQPGEKVFVQKKQTMKDFSTRKHFAGKHQLSIQVNGNILAKKFFDLLVD
jgi:3-methyladenine DNA glycosylase AlkC